MRVVPMPPKTKKMAEKNVFRGRVIEEKRYSVEVNGEKHYVPKGCDPVLDPQLEALASVGGEVEVLYANRQVIAFRLSDAIARKLKLPPIITCYMCPLQHVFDERVISKVQEPLTRAMVEAKYLEQEVGDQLISWLKKK